VDAEDRRWWWAISRSRWWGILNFSFISFLFTTKQWLLPQVTAHIKLMINAITVQIRFLVSSTKYMPIPINQKEGDPPFAPMQIVVSTVSLRIYIYAQFISVYIYGLMDSHFWLISCIGWWCPCWIYIHARSTRQILKHHSKLYLHPFMLWWVTVVVMPF